MNIGTLIRTAVDVAEEVAVVPDAAKPAYTPVRGSDNCSALTFVGMTTDKVWNDYSTEVLNYFALRVNETALAEDLRQEVFLKVHRGLPQLEDDEKLAHWLSVIVRNVMADHWKKTRIPDPTPDSVSLEGEGKELAFRTMAERCVNGMIRSLPEKYARPLILSDLDGLKQREVAERLHLSLSGAKSRVQRGRQLLRKAIDQCCRVELNARNEFVDAHCMSATCTDCAGD